MRIPITVKLRYNNPRYNNIPGYNNIFSSDQNFSCDIVMRYIAISEVLTKHIVIAELYCRTSKFSCITHSYDTKEWQKLLEMLRIKHKLTRTKNWMIQVLYNTPPPKCDFLVVRNL